MKAFRFRGARLLEWRRLQADQARGAFVRAAESARETANLLASAEAGSQRAVSDYVTTMRASVEAGKLERYRNWIGRQRGYVASCQQTHEERLAAQEKARLVLQAANRQVKIMERLRDRAERRHLEAERRMEMKAIDELATTRFARRQMEEGAARGN